MLFEDCSKGIKKLAPKTLSPILCEINNKEPKSILPSNKNNNTDLIYPIVYPALFFSVVAVLIFWLYFSYLDNQEELDKIKRKLSVGHKKLHWIKTADSKVSKN
jgi:hypothetical protein